MTVNSCLSGYYFVGGQGRQFLRNTVLVDEPMNFLLPLQQWRRGCAPVYSFIRSTATNKNNAEKNECVALELIHGEGQVFGCDAVREKQQTCQLPHEPGNIRVKRP
jgi:hypothetical protein